MKKTKLLVLTAALVLGLGTTVLADLPGNTLIIGNNAYSIQYIMQHIEELNDIINNSNSYKDIYYKQDASNITSLFGTGIATEKTVFSNSGSNNLTYYYLKGNNSASKINYTFDSNKNVYGEMDSTIKANITRTDLAGMYFINVQVTDASIVDPSKLSAKFFKVLNQNNSDLVKSIGIPAQGEAIDDYQITLMTTDPTLKISILANDRTEIGQAALNINTDLSAGLNSGKVIPLTIDSADENKSSNNGNMSGNVNNNGLLVDDGSWIYYSNLADGGKLYKKKEVQSSDKTVTLYDTKVCEDSAKYINVLGDWIYYSNYSDGQKIYKIKKDGTGRRIVCRDQASYLNVSGEYIYYAAHEEKSLSNIGKLYKVRVDAQNATSGDKISDDEAEYVSVNGDIIYFVNVTEKRALYSIHTDGTYRYKIQTNDLQVKYATLVGDYIYYITYAGDLYKVNTGGQNPTKISIQSNILNKSNNVVQVDDKILGMNITTDSLYYWSYQGGNKLYKATMSQNSTKVTGDKIGDDIIDSVNVAINGDAYYTKGGKLYIANPVPTTDKSGKTTYKYSPIAVAATKPTLKLVSYDKVALPTKNVPSSATLDNIVDYLPDKVTGVLSDSSVVEVLVNWDLEKPVIGKDGTISYKGTIVGYGGTVTFKMTLVSDPLTINNVTKEDILNQPGTSNDVITIRNLKDGDIVNVYRTMDADGKGQELLGTGTSSAGTATIKLTGSNVLSDKAGKVYFTRTSTGKTESQLYSCEFGDATLPLPLTAANIKITNYGDLDSSTVPTTDIVDVLDDLALQDGDSVVIYRDAAKTIPIANIKVQLDPNSGKGPFDRPMYQALNIKLSNTNALKYDYVDTSKNYIYVARNIGSAESEAVKIAFGKDLALPMLFGDTNILDVHGHDNDNKVTVNLNRENGYDYYYKVVSSPIDVYLKENLDTDGGWSPLTANTPIAVFDKGYVYVVQVPTGTKLAYRFGKAQVKLGTNLINETAPTTLSAPTYIAGTGAHGGSTQITGLTAGTFMYKVTSTNISSTISAGDPTVGNGWTSVTNNDWIPVTAGQFINVVSVDSRNTIQSLNTQPIADTQINAINSVTLFGASDFVFADPTGAENNGKTKATTVPIRNNIADRYLYAVGDPAKDAPQQGQDVSTLGYTTWPSDNCIPAQDGQHISIVEVDSSNKAQRFGVFKAVVGTNEAPTPATFADSNVTYLGTSSTQTLSVTFNFVKGQVDNAQLLIDDTPAGSLMSIGANSLNTSETITLDATTTSTIVNNLSEGNHTIKIRLYSIGKPTTTDEAVTSDSTVTKTLVIDNTVPTAASSDSCVVDAYTASPQNIATGGITLKFSEPVKSSNIKTIANLTISNGHTFGTSAVVNAVDDSNGYATTFKITGLDGTTTFAKNDTITITNTNVVDRAVNNAGADVTFTAN